MIKNLHLYKALFYLSKPLLVISLLLFAILFAGCCLYIFSGYHSLVNWYTDLNPCFYKSKSWSASFFTPGIKSDGNMYCLLAMGAVGLCSYFSICIFKKWRRTDSNFTISYDTRDFIPVWLCLAANGLCWRWGNSIALPASDEVFSAINVAGIHPVQAISYYMLPNNHLLFNLINNVLFHFAADKVITGRLISLVAYCAFTISAFAWLKTIIKNRWLALLVAVTLSLQFQVWGFGFQARGYELYLLAEWGMFISLFRYITSDKIRWLHLNTLFGVVGFFCLPSLLYLFVAQATFMLCYGAINKKRAPDFWLAQLATLGLTFLCYLPALCFSGLDAIANNNYVAAMQGFRKTGRIAFAQWMFPYFKPYVIHIFSGLEWSNLPVSMVLYAIPLLLLFNKKNRAYFSLGLFYMCMWVVFFVVVIIMKRLPFERNLIGHYSITLAGLLITIYWLTERLAALIKINTLKWILFPGMTLLLGIHYLRTNEQYLQDTLYEMDVNSYYKSKVEWLNNIPPGSSVAFSDEEFYGRYLSRKIGYRVSACPAGNELYYVKQEPELIPAAARYELYKKFYGNEIWKLK